VPGAPYRCEIVGVGTTTGGEPSPNVNRYSWMLSPASGSKDWAPLKLTFNGAEPVVGVACRTALGLLFTTTDATMLTGVTFAWTPVARPSALTLAIDGADE